jgi:hypothetical protein
MAQEPSVHDNSWSLWLKIASNLYDYAIGQGETGLTPPNAKDNETGLISKVAYFTARLSS